MIVNEARLLTYGLALGAGLMYVLDPRQGAARRALIRDKSRRALHDIEEAAEVGTRDMTHRLEGAVARAHIARSKDEVPGDLLVARVRAKLGHVCSHPHAIEVTAKGESVIELKGPVLAREAHHVLSAISRVPGVRVIDDDLVRHLHADVAALQGAPVKRSSLARVWTPAVRLVLGLGAGSVALASLVRGNPIGFALAGAGVLGLARASTRGSPQLFGHRGQGHREGQREIGVSQPVDVANVPAGASPPIGPSL